MSIFSLSLGSTVATTAAACMDMLAGTNSPAIMQINGNLTTATASTYGLGRAGNTPVQTSGVALLQENPADGTAGLSKLAVAWGTAPTVPTAFFRRVSLAATVGVGFVWTFPMGLKVATGASMVLWNLATNSNSVNIDWVADE